MILRMCSMGFYFRQRSRHKTCMRYIVLWMHRCIFNLLNYNPFIFWNGKGCFILPPNWPFLKQPFETLSMFFIRYYFVQKKMWTFRKRVQPLECTHIICEFIEFEWQKCTTSFKKSTKTFLVGLVKNFIEISLGWVRKHKSNCTATFLLAHKNDYSTQ